MPDAKNDVPDTKILKILSLLVANQVGRSESVDELDAVRIRVSDPEAAPALLPTAILQYSHIDGLVNQEHSLSIASESELAASLNRLKQQGFIDAILDDESIEVICPKLLSRMFLRLKKPFWKLEEKKFIRTLSSFLVWISRRISDLKSSSVLRGSSAAIGGSLADSIVKEAEFHADRLGLLDDEHWDENEDHTKTSIRDQVTYLCWLQDRARAEMPQTEPSLIVKAGPQNVSSPQGSDGPQRRASSATRSTEANKCADDLSGAPHEALQAYKIAITIGGREASLSSNPTDQEVYDWLIENRERDEIRPILPQSIASFKRALNRGRKTLGIKKRGRVRAEGRSIVRSDEL